jgi:hypothetical protein
VLFNCLVLGSRSINWHRIDCTPAVRAIDERVAIDEGVCGDSHQVGGKPAVRCIMRWQSLGSPLGLAAHLRWVCTPGQQAAAKVHHLAWDRATRVCLLSSGWRWRRVLPLQKVPLQESLPVQAGQLQHVTAGKVDMQQCTYDARDSQSNSLFRSKVPVGEFISGAET